MKQTALQQAIANVGKYCEDAEPHTREWGLIKDILSTMAQLLPAEREQIETAFHEGRAAMQSPSDYFIQNYTP